MVRFHTLSQKNTVHQLIEEWLSCTRKRTIIINWNQIIWLEKKIKSNKYELNCLSMCVDYTL